MNDSRVSLGFPQFEGLPSGPKVTCELPPGVQSCHLETGKEVACSLLHQQARATLLPSLLRAFQGQCCCPRAAAAGCEGRGRRAPPHRDSRALRPRPGSSAFWLRAAACQAPWAGASRTQPPLTSWPYARSFPNSLSPKGRLKSCPSCGASGRYQVLPGLGRPGRGARSPDQATDVCRADPPHSAVCPRLQAPRRILPRP